MKKIKLGEPIGLEIGEQARVSDLIYSLRASSFPISRFVNISNKFSDVWILISNLIQKIYAKN